MTILYPINFFGHDDWMESEYALDQAQGDVVTRDDEFLGTWRVTDYDPARPDETGGRYEFIPDGQKDVLLYEEFAVLDFRAMRGSALSQLSRTVKEWHADQEL